MFSISRKCINNLYKINLLCRAYLWKLIIQNYQLTKNKDINIETLGIQSDKYESLIQYVSFAIKNYCLISAQPFNPLNVLINFLIIKTSFKMELKSKYKFHQLFVHTHYAWNYKRDKGKLIIIFNTHEFSTKNVLKYLSFASGMIFKI